MFVGDRAGLAAERGERTFAGVTASSFLLGVRPTKADSALATRINAAVAPLAMAYGVRIDHVPRPGGTRLIHSAMMQIAASQILELEQNGTKRRERAVVTY